MSTPERIAADFRKLASRAKRMASAGARGAAKHVQATTLAELGRTPYKSKRLSNMGKGVKLKVSRRTTGVTSIVKALPPGPWAIVEEGASGHMIPSRGGNPRRLLAFRSGDVVTGPVFHPGVKGYRPWDSGVERATPGIVRAHDRALAEAVESFGG